MTTRRPLRPPHRHAPVPIRLSDAEIEQQVFALIEDHMAEPAPAVLWLTDRIASHAIVTRLRLVPARSLEGSDA
jgi:hypothetical protein